MLEQRLLVYNAYDVSRFLFSLALARVKCAVPYPGTCNATDAALAQRCRKPQYFSRSPSSLHGDRGRGRSIQVVGKKLATPPKNLENIFPPALPLQLQPGNQRVSRRWPPRGTRDEEGGQTDRNPNQSTKMLLFRGERERRG